jgi:hypothetical protein
MRISLENGCFGEIRSQGNAVRPLGMAVLAAEMRSIEGRADAPSIPVPRPAAPVAAPPAAQRPSPSPTQLTSALTEIAAAPGQFEVDEMAIERALEQALVRTGALLLPTGVAEIEPSLGYVRNEQNLPGLVVEDGQLATEAALRRLAA